MNKQNVHARDYSTLRRKKTLTYATTWRKLKDSMLSEICQSQNKIMYDSIYEESRVVKFLQTESKMVVARELGGVGWRELVFNGYRVLVLKDEAFCR